MAKQRVNVVQTWRYLVFLLSKIFCSFNLQSRLRVAVVNHQLIPIE